MSVWAIIGLVVAGLLYVLYVPTFVSEMREGSLPIWIGIPFVLLAPLAVILLLLMILVSNGPRSVIQAILMAIFR